MKQVTGNDVVTGKVVTSSSASFVAKEVKKPLEGSTSSLIDKQVPWHLKALLKASEPVLELPKGIAKAVALPPTEEPTEQPEEQPIIVSSEFNSAGHLVLTFTDGTKIASKNKAPAEVIMHTALAPPSVVQEYFILNPNSNIPHDARETGFVCWNKQEDCIDVSQADGSTLQLGLEQYIQVINKTGSTVPDGTVVMFNGVSDNELPEVQPIAALPSIDPLYLIGVVTSSMQDNEIGRVTVFGKVRQLDTTGTSSGEVWQQGDLLWVHPTQAGKLTRNKPVPPHAAISVAAVLRVSSAEGMLLVRPTIYPRSFYGKFRSLVNQVPAAIGTPYAVNFDDTQFSSGVAVVNKNKITVEHQGLYSFDFRLQVTSTNSSQKNIWIWARINGVDVPESSTAVTMLGNAAELAPSWDFQYLMQKNDYFQLMYAVSDTAVRISAPAANSFSPSAPSAVIKVNMINL